MALIDVYNALLKTTDPAGDWPTHDFVGLLALHFRNHLTANSTKSKLETLIGRSLTAAEISGLQTLKATYNAKGTAQAKTDYLNDMAWTFHAVERGSLSPAEAGAILG